MARHGAERREDHGNSKQEFGRCGGHIHGSAVVSRVVAVESVTQWRALLPQHRWDLAELPYKRTFAHSLTLVAKAAVPVPYRHPRGAIGLVRYRV